MLPLTAPYGDYPQQTLTLTAGQTSEVVLRSDGQPNPSVALHPNPTGMGRIEASLSSSQEIQDGTARWVPWPAGNVAVVTSDILQGSWTGLRAVCVTGNIKVEVQA